MENINKTKKQGQGRSVSSRGGFSTLSLILGALLLILLTAGLMYVIMKPPVEPTLPPLEPITDTESPDQPDINDDKPVEEVDIIKKGEIKWQTPEEVDLPDLKIVNQDDGFPKFNFKKLGEVVAGPHKGKKLFLGDLDYGGPSLLSFFYILSDGHSYGLLLGDDQYTIVNVTENIKPASDDISVQVVSSPQIEELTNPEKISDVNKGKDYVYVFSPDRSASNPMEKNSLVHPLLGQSYKRINDDEIYFIRPDGLSVTYRYMPKLFKKNITSDERPYLYGNGLNLTSGPQKLQESKYLTGVPGGCGERDAVTIKKNFDLDTEAKMIGTDSDGNGVYIYKHPAGHTDIAEIYENYVDQQKWKQKKSDADGVVSPHPYAPTLTIEEFNEQEYPLIFWRGPGGRVEAYFSDAFTSAAECGKPVIYLYPEKAEKVNVRVYPTAGFTVTDPEYGNIRGPGWTVWAEPSGDLTNLADNQPYPYLFWEGHSRATYRRPETGWVVARADLEIELPQILAKMGLNEKEQADFVEYWIPKMRETTTKPYYFITFVGNDFMNRAAPLAITPRPDTVWRIFMDYKGLDEKKAVSEPQIVVPKRSGFTVIEWGGKLQN